MNKIEWKPSELPEFTVVRAKHPNDSRLEAFLTKDEEGDWYVVGGEYLDFVKKERADEELEINYINSVPKSWYEEFRPIPGHELYSINRAGQTMHSKYLNIVELGRDGWLRLPINEAVRKAFCG